MYLAAEANVGVAEAEAERARLDSESMIGGINTEVARLQAELQAAEFNLQETVVRAPTDRMVLQLFLRKGMSQKVGLSSGLATVESREVQREEEISASANAPVVEVEVMRIPPNPRMILCRYWAGNEERRCTVRVGQNADFVRGMKLRVQEPSDPSAQSEPWPYPGPLPRRRGHW